MLTTGINNGLTIREYEDGIRFGTDALLLCGFAGGKPTDSVVDLGSGSGVLSLLLLSGQKAGRCTGIEFQKKYAELSSENATLNGFGERYSSVHGDVTDIKRLVNAGCADYAVSNPPYLKKECGRINASDSKYMAFHETGGTIDDFCAAAFYCLRTGGKFYVVYRSDRLCSLLSSLRNNRLEPKRLRCVHPSPSEAPSLVLCESVREGKEGMIFEAPLCIYTDRSHTVLTSECTSPAFRLDGKKDMSSAPSAI